MTNHFYCKIENDMFYIGIPKLLSYSRCGQAELVQLLFMNAFVRVGGIFQYSLFGLPIYESVAGVRRVLGVKLND